MNIFENVDSTLYRVAPVSAEDDGVSTIINELVHAGAIVDEISDDTIVASCKSRSSLEAMADLLDDDWRVEQYAINVYELKPSGLVNKVDSDTIDVDQITNFDHVRVEFIIFLNTDGVDYTSYTDIEEDDLTEKFVNTNKKQPIWLALSKTSTAAKGGTFVVTPHPVRRGAVLVHVEYKYDVEDTDFVLRNAEKITNDINTINNGLINKRLVTSNYELEDPISFDFKLDMCERGHFITAPAVYMSNTNRTDLYAIMESFEDTTLVAEASIINEVKRVIKVNFRGKKRIKLKCLPGYKYDITRKACVKITGSEKAVDRRAKIKMARTKKAAGSGFRRAVDRKTKKAKRFRKMMGV